VRLVTSTGEVGSGCPFGVPFGVALSVHAGAGADTQTPDDGGGILRKLLKWRGLQVLLHDKISYVTTVSHTFTS